MDFHHPDASKKEFAISVDGVYRSWEKVEKELERCVMLCANCHAEAHAGVRDFSRESGAADDRRVVTSEARRLASGSL